MNYSEYFLYFLRDYVVSGAPLRLLVLKNGTRDQTKTFTVVAPDLGNVRTVGIIIIIPTE